MFNATPRVHDEVSFFAYSAAILRQVEDRLDRHVVIEAAGKEPAERRDVFDVIDGLIRAGTLDVGGRGHCAFTESG